MVHSHKWDLVRWPPLSPELADNYTLQVVDVLRRAIHIGLVKQGHQFPPIHSIKLRYSLGEHTVYGAYTYFVEEGTLVKRGRYYYYTGKQPDVNRPVPSAWGTPLPRLRNEL